ncbi:MAG: FAD-binding oxidoreductase [Bacteroidales bacterium]|jgi:ferredoxin--NADP+ reductase
MLPANLKSVRVESIREIAPQVFIIEFKKFFDFEAGQIISLSLSEHLEPRMYSIASGERDNNIQVLFNVVNDGHLTPALSCLKPGDAIWSSPGFGKFTGTCGEAWWIAQGTGIAPFASMFRSGQSASKTLIHGGRHADSFYFSDEFGPVLNDHYVKCCTKEALPGGFRGRVTDYLEQLSALSPDPLYYLCGSSEMVVESRDILIKRGVPFRKIVGEIYF